MSPRARNRRRSFMLSVVLCAMAILLMFALIVARYAVLEFSRERHAALETCARQVFESARDWSRVHPDWLSDAAPCQLPLESLLPPGFTGVIELLRTAAPEGESLVQCQLMLERAGARLRQQAVWPLTRSQNSRPTH